MQPWFVILIALVSLAAGTTASIVGFGIGSLLTPLVAMRFGVNVAVASVALPHLAGGLLRGWRLRRRIDRGILARFGIVSALGGLVGALVFARLAPAALSRALGLLLLMTASAGVLGWPQRWRPRGGIVWVLGAVSGFFGGVVGNQGGLRAAALSAFELEPAAFVATSTAVGVIIDVVRVPIYLSRIAGDLGGVWPLIAFATAGVLAGTLIGERVLRGLSHAWFRVVVSTAIGLLGVWFLFGPA